MKSDRALIIYDGDCVFCQNYIKLIRLRQTVGTVDLVDARSNDPRVLRYWRDGYDLNEGMIFVLDGKVFHGAKAVNILARLSSPTSIFNRLNRLIFRSAVLTKLAYPLLRAGRSMTLLLRGKRYIDDPTRSGQ
jgi:predicted DCC family thiol-disulfide oxidoreductase YuxK